MKRQVVTTDEHGRTTWTYVDQGPATVTHLRGSLLARPGEKHGDNLGRKVTGPAGA